MSEPLWQPRTDVQARLLGIGFLTGGGAMLAYQAKGILDAVASQAERVTYFMAAVALGEMGVIIGAYWLMRGLAGYQTVRALQKNPGQLRGLLIASAVVMAGSLLGIETWLRAHGYDS